MSQLGVTRTMLVLCAAIGVVAGLGGYTFWYAEGLSYFSSDPRGCINCHIMREHYDGWSKASHHAVATCVDCHLPHDLIGKYVAKAENGWNHSVAFTLQNFPEPIRITPRNAHSLQENCIDCHKDMVADLVAHGSFADESNTCVRCHLGVGHGPTR